MAFDRDESFASVANKVIQELSFDRQELAMWRVLSDYPLLQNNAKIKVTEQAVGGLLFMLRAWCLDGHRQDIRKETEDIEFPATPWEFYKQEYAPNWFHKKCPVKTKTTRITVAEHHHHLCPHVVVEDKWNHFKWMAVQSGQWKENDGR